MFLVNRATKRPQRPSEFLGLRSRGYDETTLIDFDFAVEWFDIWYQARADATTEVPAERRNGPPMRSVPKYETIAAVLGLDDEDNDTPLTEDQRDLMADLVAGRIDPEEMLARSAATDD